MDYKYYRDLKHNYLVLENRAEEAADRYQYKMMESGRIRGLVPCAERNINGERFLYYEIGSMQPLKDRFAVGGMSSLEFTNLLRAVSDLLEELGEYLLGEEGLVFNTASVFSDLSTGDFKFMYCPFYDEAMGFADFATQLLDLVDITDEKAAEMAYLLCEKSAMPGAFTLETIRAVLKECGSCRQEKEILEPVDCREPAPDDVEDFSFEEESAPSVTKRGGRLKRAEQMMGGRLQLLFSLMFVAVVAAMVYIRMNFILTKEENLMSILVMLVSLITGAVSFVCGSREYMGKLRSGKRALGEAEALSYAVEEYDDFDDPVTGGGAALKITGPMSGRTTASTIGRESSETACCGETVVLDRERENGDFTLFSRNLDKTERIGLEKLPLTIGKMEGCVDKVLGDSSVSRIHCRLSRVGERIAIEDLGSTNGTYRNGIRLNPREMAYIDEGDEIRLGRVCFDCR